MEGSQNNHVATPSGFSKGIQIMLRIVSGLNRKSALYEQEYP